LFDRPKPTAGCSANGRRIFHAVTSRFFHNVGTNITNYSVTAGKTKTLTAAYLQHCCLEWKWRSGNQL